ncbi:MAG: sterol desaturase family protein [Pseudomonadota bacterium]
METLIYFAIPAFVLLILLEWAYSQKAGQHVYSLKDTMACLSMGLGNVAINAATAAAVLGLYTVVYQFRVFDLAPFALSTWALLLFAEDFCYYWFHRVHHESRIGWAGHVNHHSSTHYNLAVALRQSWTTRFTGVVFWLPLALLGFHPLMILAQQAVSLIYQFWIHTQTIHRLGPFEWIMNTPSHHRVHHGSNPQYIDRNYGGIFIVWDRLFGTFEPEGEKVEYGLTNNIKTYNPLRIAFHEWAAMVRDAAATSSLGDALRVLFKHPKWFSDSQR